MKLAAQLIGAPQFQLDHVPITAGIRFVAARFWTDYDPAKALASLRHTRWEAAQSIGEGWIRQYHSAWHLLQEES